MPELEDVRDVFDKRASTYNDNRWHVRYAERLVELARLRPGECVLDAATGTGFAAFAAARATGPTGSVIGIDLSERMLQEARTAVGRQPGNLCFRQGDATNLATVESASIDVVLCSAGLLYMPVRKALREWYRVLKPGGRVGFSTMRIDSPPAARLFRECAAQFGFALPDPNEPLGTEARCRDALEAAGFTVESVHAESVRFARQDLAMAWEANVASPAYAAVRTLPPERLQQFEARYRDLIAQQLASNEATLRSTAVLYAFGIIPFQEAKQV